MSVQCVTSHCRTSFYISFFYSTWLVKKQDVSSNYWVQCALGTVHSSETQTNSYG